LGEAEAVAIILGPVVAMVIGHVFAAALAAYPTPGRRPMRRELSGIVRHESHFLLVCAPQITLLLLLSLVGLSLTDTVRVLIWVGTGSLGFWGGLAAQRAGLRWRGIAVGVIAGLAAGGAVLLIQVFLQPGKAVSHGVAAIECTSEPPHLAAPLRSAWIRHCFELPSSGSVPGGPKATIQRHRMSSKIPSACGSVLSTIGTDDVLDEVAEPQAGVGIPARLELPRSDGESNPQCSQALLSTVV
jgi:hypothetical protein